MSCIQQKPRHSIKVSNQLKSYEANRKWALLGHYCDSPEATCVKVVLFFMFKQTVASDWGLVGLWVKETQYQGK